MEIVLGESSEKIEKIPVNYLCRHGIIAGSSGSGKSRAMQLIAEQLADNSITVFVSDVKGDASGFCKKGLENERNENAPFSTHSIKTNYWSISNRFARLRFSLEEIGSILISRMLSLNPTQESHLSLAFIYAKKNGHKLNSIEDLLSVLQKMSIQKQRGVMQSSVSVIERKLYSLEESGLWDMFGLPSIEIEDIKGLNVLNLSDARKNMAATLAPAFLLKKLFDQLPEEGDIEQPKLVIFFDEAHYLFNEANKSLNDLIITILKQIRSKGVSVFFVTQEVSDIPDEILGQLASKIIFCQRTLTQKGNSKIKALSKSFPKTSFDIEEKLKTLATGISLVCLPDQKGMPLPPIETNMFAPATSMEVITDEELYNETDEELIEKYKEQKIVKKEKITILEHKKIESNKIDENKKIESLKPKEIQKLVQPKKESIKKYQKESEQNKQIEPRSNGSNILAMCLGIIQQILNFIAHNLGRLIEYLIFRPISKFIKYLLKKPIRIFWFLLFILICYIIFINWDLINSLLSSFKIQR